MFGVEHKTIKEFIMKADLHVISSTRKILKNEKLEKQEPFIARLAGNEFESFQVIITANEDIKAYTLKLSSFTNDNGEVLDATVEVLHEKYMQVDEIVEPEQKNGMIPGSYPDPLIPYEKAVEYKENFIPQGENQGIWVSISTTQNAKSGVYKAIMEIDLDGEVQNLPLEIKVYNFALPREVHYNSNYAIGLDTILPGEGNYFLATYRKYVERLLEFKLAPFRFLPDPRPQYVTPEEWTAELEYYLDKEKEGGPYVSSFSIPVYNYAKYVNEERFQMYVETLFLLSIKRGENLFARGTGVHAGFIDEPHLNNTYDLANSVCKHFEELKVKTVEMLREKHGTDDFKEAMYAEIVDIGNYVTSYFDDRLTEIKNWCPASLYFAKEEDRKNYVKHGKAWWYVCGAGSPFSLNIDHTALDVRMEGWMRDAYSISGCYYWQTTYFYKAIWEQAIHLNCKTFIDTYKEAVRFGKAAGDGFLFYPMKPYGLDKPAVGIRMHLLRDSAEDYEYLHLLRSLYSKAGKDASKIIEEVQQESFVDLTLKVDDNGYYAQRDKIAKYIEDALNGIFY